MIRKPIELYKEKDTFDCDPLHKKITELQDKLKVAREALEDMVNQAIEMDEDCYYSYHAKKALKEIGEM